MNQNISYILEEHFKQLFQKEIQFKTNNKTICRGKMLNFRIEDSQILFKMLKEDVGHFFEFTFFIPFDIDIGDNVLILDYSLETYCNKDPYLMGLLKIVSEKERFKKRAIYFNSILELWF